MEEGAETWTPLCVGGTGTAHERNGQRQRFSPLRQAITTSPDAAAPRKGPPADPKPKLSKAERRELQESQRAAKAELKGEGGERGDSQRGSSAAAASLAFPSDGSHASVNRVSRELRRTDLSLRNCLCAPPLRPDVWHPASRAAPSACQWRRMRSTLRAWPRSCPHSPSSPTCAAACGTRRTRPPPPTSRCAPSRPPRL